MLIAQIIVLQLSQLAYSTLNVQVLNTQLAVGGSGFLDVLITGEGDLVESASLQLQIAPVNAVSSSLQFLNPQVINFDADPNYLFSGNSFNQLFSIDPRVVSQTTSENDTYATNDSTSDLANISVTGLAKLLARVDLKHVIPQGTNPGSVVNDLFQVSVVLNQTSFLNSAAAPVNFAASGPGTVTFAAVPEPSSATLLLISSFSLLHISRRLNLRGRRVDG